MGEHCRKTATAKLKEEVKSGEGCRAGFAAIDKENRDIQTEVAKVSEDLVNMRADLMVKRRMEAKNCQPKGDHVTQGQRLSRCPTVSVRN
jgi:hypothetical protein